MLDNIYSYLLDLLGFFVTLQTIRGIFNIVYLAVGITTLKQISLDLLYHMKVDFKIALTFYLWVIFFLYKLVIGENRIINNYFEWVYFKHSVRTESV